MATETWGKLASSRPANTNEAQLYVVPASCEIVAVLWICNQTALAVTYRVAFGDGDAAATDEWIYYDVNLEPNMTHKITNISLQATYDVRIKSGTSDAISFVLGGLKIDSS